MQNDKLGLFDLLTFIVPGGTMLYFLAFSMHTFVRLDALLLMGDSNYLLVPFFFLSYYIGHLLSFVARKWEHHDRIGLGEKEAWTIYLKQNLDRAKRLDAHCQKQFGYSFLENDVVSAKKSDSFFDSAYVLLETKQKFDKIGLLMAQFTFFRSAVVVFIFATLALITSLLVAKAYGINLAYPFPYYCLIVFCFLSIFISKKLMHERKRWMMTAVYQNFEAYCQNT
jgi:hypothetical protein